MTPATPFAWGSGRATRHPTPKPGILQIANHPMQISDLRFAMASLQFAISPSLQPGARGTPEAPPTSAPFTRQILAPARPRGLAGRTDDLVVRPFFTPAAAPPT